MDIKSPDESWYSQPEPQKRPDDFFGKIIEANLPTGKDTKDRWTYEGYLKWYLLLISRDRNALLPLGHYPWLMRLPEVWNEAFKDAIDLTKKTGKECFGVIASDSEDGILLTKRPSTSDPHKISHNIAQFEFNWSTAVGADYIIGSYHTHLAEPKYSSLLKRILLENSMFTPKDLYALAVDGRESMEIILQPNKQMAAAFKSRDTKLEADLSYLPEGYKTQDNFATYWFMTKGIALGDSSQSTKLRSVGDIPRDELIDLVWEINNDIAKKTLSGYL